MMLWGFALLVCASGRGARRQRSILLAVRGLRLSVPAFACRTYTVAVDEQQRSRAAAVATSETVFGRRVLLWS